MATRWGTSHFVSYEKATNYYSSLCYGYSNTQTAVDRKLSDGEIHIGPPTAKTGEKVSVDPDGRYWIEDDSNINVYIGMMKAQGWRVYQRPIKGISRGEYCYCTDGKNIAYAQWSDGRPQVSTVHKPNRTTGGGFQFDDHITPDIIRKAMSCIAPSWARPGAIQSVIKYKDWEEFHKANSFNAELVEVL